MSNWRYPPKLEIGNDVLAQIEEHSYSTLEFEVGGMLIGEIDGRTTRIVGSIPALKASASQINLTFTHEVWEAILEEADAKFPDYSIVGWYHTHPGFGIFLSEYDRFIQDNFFNQKGQVALVVDPVAGQLGWFSHDSRRKVRKFDEAPTVSGVRRKPSGPEGSPAKAPVGRIVLAASIAFIFGAALSWAVSSAIQPPDVRPALLEANSEIGVLRGQLQESLNEADGLYLEIGERDAEFEALTQEFGDVQQRPVLLYTVAEGESLRSIAIRFYGDELLVSQIAEYNTIAVDDELVPGTRLRLENVPGITVGRTPGAPAKTEPAPQVEEPKAEESAADAEDEET